MTAIPLRVLAGPNAGAEVNLTDGDWLIGTDENADLTLAEPTLAEQHLRLSVTAGRVTLHALAPGTLLWDRPVSTGESFELEPGVPVAIGGTRFALGTGPLREPPPPPRPPEPEPEPEPQGEAVPPPRRRSRRLPVLALGGMLLAVLLPVGGVVWLVESADAPALKPPPRNVILGSATAVIRRLGLADRVSARIEGDQLVVAGQVEDGARLEALTRELAASALAPELAVVTDATVADLAGTVLRAFGIEGTAKVTGPGRVQLEGLAPDEQRIEAATRRLRSDVPGLATIEDRLATPGRIGATLDAELRGAGLGDKIRLTGLQGTTVQVGGAVMPADLETWGRIAERFAARFPPPVRLVAHLAAVTRAVPRGVSLGPSPFVVLEDGQRLTIGDTYDKATVVGIAGDGLRLRIASGDVSVPFAEKPRWVMEDPNGDGK